MLRKKEVAEKLSFFYIKAIKYNVRNERFYRIVFQCIVVSLKRDVVIYICLSNGRVMWLTNLFQPFECHIDFGCPPDLCTT